MQLEKDDNPRVQPWTFIAVGGALLVIGIGLSARYTAAFRKEQGAFLTNLMLEQRDGSVVPRWVSLMYLAGLGLAGIGVSLYLI